MKLLPIPLSPLNAPPPLGLWNSELLWRYPPAPPSPLADLKTQLPPQLNTDPRIWGRDEVVVFLRFCEREFDLPKFDLDLFQMNGKALCVLTKNDLAERSPGAGDVLHNVLQMLIRDAQTLHRHLPSSPVTPTGRYPLSPHSHPPTPNWSALAPPDSPFFHSSHLQQFMAASNSVTLSPAPSIDSQAGSPPSQSHAEQNVFQQQQQQPQPAKSSGAGSSSSSSSASSTNGSAGSGSANGNGTGPGSNGASTTNGSSSLISSSSSNSSAASSTSSSVSNQSDSDEDNATVGNGSAATSTTGSSTGNGFHPLPLSHPDSKLPLIATHPPQQSPPLTPISKETQHLGQLQLLDTKTLQYPVSSLLNGSSPNGGSGSRDRDSSSSVGGSASSASSNAAAAAAAMAAAVLGLKGASNGSGSSGSSGSNSAPTTPGAFLPVKREFFPDSPEPNTISSGSLSDGRLLWDFLQQLLNDPSQRYSSYIAWKCRDTGVFKIVDPAGLAKLWGKQKNHLSMNYDKMSRALRYYYRVNILRKVQGERHCYQFLRNPTELKSIKNISLLRQTMAASQAAAAAAAAQSGTGSERNGTDRGPSSAGNGSPGGNNPLMSLLPNGANIHHLAAAAAVAAAASQNGPLSPSSSSSSSSPSSLHHHHLQQQQQQQQAALHSHHLAVQNGAGSGVHHRSIKMETDLDDLKPTDLSTNDRKFSYGSPVNGTDCYPLIRNANGLTTIQLLRQQQQQQQQQQSESGSPPSSPTPLSINSQSLHTISSNLHHLHQQQLQAQAAAAAAIAAAAEARHQQDDQADHPHHHHLQHPHHHPARNGSRSSSTSGASEHDHREPHDHHRDRDTPSPANSDSSTHHPAAPSSSQSQQHHHHHHMHVKSDDDSMMPTDLSKSEPMYYK
ncbi:ets DNA-binding protein pokkuri isoform X1 [Anopheles stephensi]|uniref:ets DNA-binding protein pokkuri isoform X1 n=1 Tax=Anopheles stephensi TaxID=30069 RepID=UPI00165879BB|nr:ets DNA-binding protein pokkuri isoform X1 [Anopheles stephensi]XP_035909044.1 ets DNA-binding protein pokkuri isoform X1 [Anopheles stephensi]XP_035909045.1 ets DNA-binding protein pokkuri isoform X1 [Anopheles stephensi]XP_035909046.1 ets DNA-binding protein pokkuri isoform X1 [Anopheles stephensi]XP_035909047.1 ets DNA-binding protein pokkuri isoform X1 [Anopheles stephensi]